MGSVHRILILLFFLPAVFADYYFGGSLRSFSATSIGFNLGSPDVSNPPAYASSSLTLLGKPTLTGSLASILNSTIFSSWWNTAGAALSPYTVKLVTSGSLASFQSASGFTPGNSTWWTLELMGQVPVSATAATWTFGVAGGEMLVYINGVLQSTSNIWGVQTGFRTATVSVSTTSLGVSAGNYPVNIFVTHRIAGAAQVTIQVSDYPTFPTGCGIVHARNEEPYFFPFLPSNMSLLLGANVTLTSGGNALNLSNDALVFQSFAAWSTKELRIHNGFRTHFQWSVNECPSTAAQGFAFVVQSSGLGVTGGSGFQLGYGGISNSLAVEFDLNFSGVGIDPTSPNPHIEVHSLYAAANTADRSVAGALVGSTAAMFPTGTSFTPGTLYQAIIQYQPGTSGQGTISVWSGTASPDFTFTQTPVLSVTTVNDVSMRTGVAPNGYVYAGFTTVNNATGCSVYFPEWRFWETPVNAESNVQIANNGVIPLSSTWTTEVVSNVQTPFLLQVETYDVCNTPIGLVGDIITAQLTSTAGADLGNTLVSQNNNGTYNVAYWHTVAEQAQLWLYVNGENIQPWNLQQYINVSFTPAAISASYCRYATVLPSPTAFSTCTVAQPCQVIAGENVTFTLTAYDQFGNLQPAPTTGFSVNFAGDNPFNLTSALSPPYYQFTGYATRAVLNNGINVRFQGVDIGTANITAVPPTRLAGIPTTPTPITPVNVLAATPADVNYTAGTVTGPGYAPGPVAGTTGFFNVTPIDIFDNPITGSQFTSLTPPTFSLACSPSAVTADTQARCNAASWTYNVMPIGNSLWQLSFNSTLATTYIITILINGGTPLPGLNFVTVSTAPPNGTNTIFFTSTNYTASVLSSFTFQAEDSFQNYVLDQPTGGSYTVTIGGATVTCGSGSSVSAGNVSTLSCSFVNSGLYSVSFIPNGGEGNYPATVTWTGALGGSSSVNLLAITGPADPFQSSCSGQISPIVAGVLLNLTITSRDRFGNIRVDNDDASLFTPSLQPTAGAFVPQGLVISPVTQILPANGSYSFNLVTDTAGSYQFLVLLLGSPLGVFNPNPFTIVVNPSYGNATTSLVSGPGVQGAKGGQATSFFWQSVDSYGNKLTSTTDTFSITITNGTSSTTATVVAQGNGIYLVSFVSLNYSGEGATYNISVHLTSLGVPTSRMIGPLPIADPGDVNNGLIYYGTLDAATGIAFSSEIPSPVPINLYFDSLCLVCGSCGCGPRTLDPVTAGVLSSFNITDRDVSPFKNITRDPPTAYVVQFISPTGGVTEALPTQITSYNSTTDVFTLSFTLTATGIYNVTVSAAGGAVQTTESMAGILLPVEPGPLSPPNSLVSGFPNVITAGNSMTYSVRYRDAFSNLITTDTTQYVLDFELFRNTDNTNIASTILNAPLPPIVDASGIGNVSITFAPTLAGNCRVVTQYNGTNFGPATASYDVTVNPATVDPANSCIGVNPPAACPTILSGTIVAGSTWVISLYVQDKYGNGLVDPAQTFNVSVELNGWLATSTQYVGGPLGTSSAGLYYLSVVPTQRVVYELNNNTGNTVEVWALPTVNDTASSVPLVPTLVATTIVNINPSDVSSTTSFVTGLPVVVEAGTQIVFSLSLRDRFGNPWFDNPSALSVVALGPGVSRQLTVGAPGTADGLQPAPFNPDGVYTIRFTPTKSTDNPGDTNITFVIRVNGQQISPQNLTGVEVIAAAPYAPSTTYNAPPPPASSIQWFAGSLNNITVQLVDIYGNLLYRGGNNVTVTYLDGSATCLSNNVLNVSAVTTANFDPTNIVDNGDGTYTIWVNTTRAGTYTAAIYVQSGIVRQCLQTDTTFNIYPLGIWPPACIISGPAVTDPQENIAGVDIYVNIILNDKYGNRVCYFCTQAPCTTTCLSDLSGTPLVGPWSGAGDVTPTIPPTFCQSPANESDWIDLSAYPINDTVSTVELSTVPGTPQSQYGTFQITFQAQVARTWNLVAVLNTTTLPGWQAVGTQCVNITILPSYVYTFSLDQTSTIWAGIPSTVTIPAQDRFGNVVLNGSHYWLSTYTWPTSNTPSLLRYAISSQSSYDAAVRAHTLSFVLHWDGEYSVFLQLVNNPGPALNPTRSQVLTVTGATCERQLGNSTAPYRCLPEAPCYSTFSQCGLPTCAFYCANGAATFPDATIGCSGSACGNQCLLGQSACSLDGNAYTDWCLSGGQCPTGNDDRNPADTSNICNGWYRETAADCPSKRVCVQGMIPCPDGVSCVFNPADCFLRNVSCSGSTPYQCEDGRCVSTKFDCPTPPTCATGGVLCPDGSCQSSEADCPSIYNCYPPNPLRCQDGSCRASFNDCPSRVTCPPGWVLCDSGHCVETSSLCSVQNCTLNNVRCPDGSCRVTFDLCATGITCPPSTPVLCPDFTCVTTASQCVAPLQCSSGWVQCPRGQCAPTLEDCATGRICPVATPVLCADGTCQVSSTLCGFSAWCPVHRPYRCIDGACSASYNDCPSPLVCPANAPVRCASGGCVPSDQMCPDQTTVTGCPTGLWPCAGGGCAPTLSQCPTAVTCQIGEIRCGDGSCRSDCTGVLRPTQCEAGFVECPDYESGFSCATSYDNCPQAPACPRDRPVRCADRSCQMTVSLCPPLDVISGSATTCPGNVWTDANCGQSSVCPPELPVKCWDETCRLLAQDCPAVPLCSYTAPATTNIQPYLCSDGACAPDLFQCTTNQPCSPSNYVKCPGYTVETGGSLCAPNVSACSALSNSSNILICPDGKSRCQDASCQSTCPSVTCPNYISYLCPDGKCVRTSTECNNAFGCPPAAPSKCSDGSCAASASACPAAPTCSSGLTLCPDGSCAETCTVTATGCGLNLTRCYSGICAAQSLCVASSSDDQFLPNACPGSRPYRCSNGYCAISSAFCPHFPQAATCEYSAPFLCADGSCQLTAAACAVIAPCPCTDGVCTVRCGDGSCQTANAVVANQSVSTNCPAYSRCSGSTPYICEDGLCAANDASCVDPWTGCPAGVTKQPNGTCSSTAPAPLNGWNGCLLTVGSYKCWDGSCVGGPSNCPPAPEGCSPVTATSPGCELASKPCSVSGQVRCPDGSCASVGSCKTALGCALSTPFRCADGSCKRYPADGLGSSTNTCVPVVVCPPSLPNICADGSCAADPTYCPAFWPCPSGQIRCTDFTCRDSCPSPIYTTSDTTVSNVFPCPPGSPTLCPNGACVLSARECGSPPGEICSSSVPFKCYDGSCVASPANCTTLNAQAQGAAFTGIQNADTFVCGSTEFLCWNGACLPTTSSWLCPPVPACPADFPYRCIDGSCVNRTAGGTCGNGGGTCISGTQRCPDGLCRTTCPLFQGCASPTGLACPTQAVQCIAGSSTGAEDWSLCNASPQQVCASNCFRDIPAVPQVVSASVLEDTIVDIAVLDNAPSTWIEIPSGAFGGSSSVKFTPVTQSQLTHGYVVINGVPESRTFQQAVLGTPFGCQVDTVSGAAGVFEFPLNITVYGMVDTTSFDETNQVVLQYSTPCDWIGTWELTNLQYQVCTGTVVFGSDQQSIQFNLTSTPTDDSECDTLGFTGTIIAAPTPISGGYQVIWNVTSVSLANSAQIVVVGQNVCTTLIDQGSRRMYMSLGNASALATCAAADPNEPAIIRSLRVDDPATFTNPDACSAAANNALIGSTDICFGQYQPGRRQFQCFAGYYERTEADPQGFPSWVPASGRPSNVMRGRLESCQPDTYYGFFYVPLPPQPQTIIGAESEWDKYGKIALGVTIPLVFILCVLFYAIWRLKRYRDKYKEEKVEAEELRAHAAEIAETHGGLGVWDEEVQMVSNPLVLQFNEQKKKLDEVDQTLGHREELDRLEMERLDKERQMIVEEMNRLKDMLQKQQENKKAQRVDDAPAVQPAVAAGGRGAQGPTADWDSAGSGVEQHTFQPEALGAKPRKKEF